MIQNSESGGKKSILSRTRHTGFTLLELLVVVGIITLLLAIVLPSLYKAQGRVRTVTCQSNLKQWGIYLVIYANDNGGFLPTNSRDWLIRVQPAADMARIASAGKSASFNDGRNSVACCPTAVKPSSDKEGQPFNAYTIQGYSSEPLAIGSYGINGWVCNAPSSETQIYGVSTRNNWRRFDVDETPSKIPLVLDSMWMRAFPDNTNFPPEKNGDFDNCDTTGAGRRQMRHFSIDRHEGGTNGIFLDLSVHRIGLKKLWKLKWHRGSDLNAAPPIWPDWMASLADD